MRVAKVRILGDDYAVLRISDLGNDRIGCPIAVGQRRNMHSVMPVTIKKVAQSDWQLRINEELHEPKGWSC